MAESSGKDSPDVPSQAAESAEDGLDELLDSALDDFTAETKEKTVEKKADDDVGFKMTDEVEQMWAEMMKQALQIDPNIRDMFQPGGSGDNSFVQDFSKVAEAAAKVMEGDCPTNFGDIMSETLRNLNESSESIQNQFGNPEELSALFQELGLNGGGPGLDGNVEEMPPMMQSIMQSFLSKDIIYPSIKDFVDRYPGWLEENKATLAQEQYDDYCKQLELMKKVVDEFEAESESDSADVKKQRFQRILGYMQQMQSLGQPPAEMVGALSPEESVMPSLPPGMDAGQCCVM